MRMHTAVALGLVAFGLSAGVAKAEDGEYRRDRFNHFLHDNGIPHAHEEYYRRRRDDDYGYRDHHRRDDSRDYGRRYHRDDRDNDHDD